MWSALLRQPHKRNFGTLSNRLECHKVPRLPRKTTWQPAWKPSKRRGLAASPKDTATPQENHRLETRHVGAAKRAFRARHPPILTLSTGHQTGWNVTKCHACHAKRHDNLLGNLRKGEVLQLPPKTRRRHRKTIDSRGDTWAQQNEHFVRDILQFWHFRHVIKQVGMSQSATPATQNDMTTCLETFQKDRFCSFPHRHGINDLTTTRRRPVDDPTRHSRRTRVQPPDPQTINGNPSLRIREKLLVGYSFYPLGWS